MLLAVFSHLNTTALTGPENPLNMDAWDGYQANKNRTLQTLYDNNINNNIVVAGDSHANWVSDLTWLDHNNNTNNHHPSYNPTTGTGAIGVEFAGTAITSPSAYGENITADAANELSKALVNANANDALQWAEGYYRGYYELRITPEEVGARFFGMPIIKERDAGEVSLANFTVKSGENRLRRGADGVVGDGVVGSGWLKNGQVVWTGVVYNNETNR